jgi:ribosomal protein S18 acetylase RimI-like enzyme
MIKEMSNPEAKSNICNGILRALPDWFANEEPIVGYTEEVRSYSFYAAFDGDKAIGFIALKVHNEYTAEICVMGILPGYHRQGVGRELVAICEEYCVNNHKSFLTVKTLDTSADYEPYERTRSFYRKMGFLPLEVFPLYWDKDNPCLLLAKHIDTVRR